MKIESIVEQGISQTLLIFDWDYISEKKTIWGEHSLGAHGTNIASLHKHSRSPPRQHRDVEGYDSEILIRKHDYLLIWKHIGLLNH